MAGFGIGYDDFESVVTMMQGIEGQLQQLLQKVVGCVQTNLGDGQWQNSQAQATYVNCQDMWNDAMNKMTWELSALHQALGTIRNNYVETEVVNASAWKGM
jgi:uncharacterized protein YukE